MKIGVRWVCDTESASKFMDIWEEKCSKWAKHYVDKKPQVPSDFTLNEIINIVWVIHGMDIMCMIPSNALGFIKKYKNIQAGVFSMEQGSTLLHDNGYATSWSLLADPEKAVVVCRSVTPKTFGIDGMDSISILRSVRGKPRTPADGKVDVLEYMECDTSKQWWETWPVLSDDMFRNDI